MKLCVFTICKDEARMMVWFLRHYSTIADKIIVFDEQSTDGTRDLVKACPRAELREWPWRGLDDEKFQFAVNNWYTEARGKFDYVAWVDLDELLWSPTLLRDIERSNADVIATTGYALINRNGWPVDDLKSQAYELVKTGMRQSNYDKPIIWRPEISIEHAIGRHRYEGQWPRYSGKPIVDVGVKLFHLHHLGALEGTAEINARNFGRAVNKKYAWNYTVEHNKPDQVGTVAWVKEAIEGNKLFDVVGDMGKPQAMTPKPGRRIQFGSGGLLLPMPWENFDNECDISKPLPFPNGCASFVSAGHVIEHLRPQEAWSFLEECFRILQPGGVVRIAFPDIARLTEKMTPEYAKAVKDGGHGSNPIRACVFSHGHQGAWTAELMICVMESIGFKAKSCAYGESDHNELHAVEMHHKTVGDSIARLETTCVEGVKP